MSIYRKFESVPRDDAHYFSTQRTRSHERTPQPRIEWLARRKANPCEQLLTTTARWYASLPRVVQPQALRARLPRIANSLAAGWHDRHTTTRYFDDLLTDRRGDRKGFPADLLDELHRLKSFYEVLEPTPDDIWRSASLRK
ncbi:MAG: hypothetical protein M3R31_03070 [Pseudomonadota bacterium]|nr:hypothetical protein [Pseudomonadota bacterium]